MGIELRHLRALIAVVDAGTITAASRHLNITQPALTRTIQQLERDLGTLLFERASRSIFPTPDGAEFAQRVRSILGDLDAAIGAQSRYRTIRMGFSWLLPDPWAHKVITESEARSGARILLHRCDDPVVALEDSTIDVAIMRGRVSSRPDLIEHQLFKEARVAAVSVHSPLASESVVTWKELAQWPLVANTLTGTTCADSWDSPDPSRSIVTCKNFDEWLELVAANRGIGAVPEVARRRISHHNIRFIEIEDAPPSTISLVYKRTRVTPLLRILRDVAIQMAAKG